METRIVVIAQFLHRSACNSASLTIENIARARVIPAALTLL
jgi:hypothetical protein